MTDTPQGRPETNEVTGEIRTFDPDKPFTTRDGRKVNDFRSGGNNAWRYSGYVEGGSGPTTWKADGTYVMGPTLNTKALDLVNTPPPVSGGASTCDRPGQTDAAVAQAEHYEWRRKVDFNGPGPWYRCDRSWIDHLVGDDLYETRSLYVTSEAVLLAAKPRSEWRPIETAPSGKWVLLNYGEVFASHTGYRQNDGKWVHPGDREPVAWMHLPSTNVSSPPPPVSGGASTCDRPGQTDAAVAQADTASFFLGDRLPPPQTVPSSWEPTGKPFAWHVNSGCRDYFTTDEVEADDWRKGPLLVRPLYASPEAALRAAVPRKLEGWRPIETAPKDGSRMLVWHRFWQCGAQVGYYHEPTKWWRIGDETAWIGVGIFPSHYMPLLAPPTAAPSKETGEGDRKAQVQADQMKHALSYGHRAPTAAAPSPGRENNFSKLVTIAEELCCSVECAVADIGGQRRPIDVLKDLGPAVDGAKRALARREPTRLEGGVTQALQWISKQRYAEDRDTVCVENGAQKCFEAFVKSNRMLLAILAKADAALEAAASAAPSDAGGTEGRS